jgi:hypothetical protein
LVWDLETPSAWGTCVAIIIVQIGDIEKNYFAKIAQIYLFIYSWIKT